MIRVRSPPRKRKWSTARMGRGREGESAPAAHLILSAVAAVAVPRALTRLSEFGRAVRDFRPEQSLILPLPGTAPPPIFQPSLGEIRDTSR